MSFNILCDGTGCRDWPQRISAVVQTIRRWNPDTFGVQEAHWGWMQALAENFPDYTYVGVGREDGLHGGEFSAVFYRIDAFHVIDQGTFWLSQTPDVIGSKGWDGAYRRVCSWAWLRCAADGKEFVHMNTHLDHVGKIAMEKGAETLCLRADNFPAELPVILTGDFNATPNSIPILKIRQNGFLDARCMSEHTDYGATFHAFSDDSSTHQLIDYIFCRGSINIKRFCVIREPIEGQFPSDHYPIVAELTI